MFGLFGLRAQKHPHTENLRITVLAQSELNCDKNHLLKSITFDAITSKVA